jgi:hypothetical protein
MPAQLRRKTSIIRELNDNFRSTFRGGRVVFTPGILSLTDAARGEIVRRTMTFSDFNDGNDPYQEHDFIAFELEGSHIFVKIDYYAPDFEHGSDDPSDPAKTARVMTIMTPEEY